MKGERVKRPPHLLVERDEVSAIVSKTHSNKFRLQFPLFHLWDRME